MSAYRRTFDTKTWLNKYEPTEEPEVLIKPKDERVEVNKVTKKNLDLLNKKDREAIEAAEKKKDYLERVPNEVTHCNEEDGAMIHNFEVDFEPEEEL